MRKSDEQAKRRYFRSDERFFRVDSQWFFTTREGDEGPFATREQAQAQLRHYLALQEMKEEHGEKIKRIREDTPRGDPGIWNSQIDAL